VVQLSRGWFRIGLVTWVGALFALAATAITSRTVGKPTWWLGPSTDPSSFLTLLVPVTLTVAPAVVIVLAPRIATRAGLACAAGIAVMALFDAGDSPGVALVEAAIAVAGAAISVALRAGRTTVEP
jgi:hypothetical protein